jgi:hypothetical protein
MLDGHILMLIEAVHNIPPGIPQSLNVGGLGVVQSFNLLEELGADQLEPLIESQETQQELYLVFSLSVAPSSILSRHSIPVAVPSIPRDPRGASPSS